MISKTKLWALTQASGLPSRSDRSTVWSSSELISERIMAVDGLSKPYKQTLFNPVFSERSICCLTSESRINESISGSVDHILTKIFVPCLIKDS